MDKNDIVLECHRQLYDVITYNKISWEEAKNLMDKINQQILEGLRQIIGTGRLSFPATVTENYPDKDYVDVEDMAGTPYPEVRKRAAVDDKKGILITPVKGSTVIISKLSGDDSNSFVIMLFSEVDSIKITIENHVLVLDKDGLSANVSSGTLELKNDQMNIADLFLSIMDIISQLTVTTPSGNSSTPLPPTMQAIEKFKQDIKKLLK